MSGRNWLFGVGMMGAVALLGGQAIAQQQGPAPSPAAMVQQVVGVNPITITYSSPGVKGRVIWGELVPYDTIWRAGANARTTIEFTEDVRIEGKPLAAGKYGFLILPTKENWTLIFSKDAVGAGGAYDEKDDALRVTVKPKEAPFRERLAYGFDNMTDTSATCYLHWERLMAEWKIELGKE